MIQLIDRNVQWHIENEPLAQYQIYMDCDHEYVQVESSNLKRDSPLCRFLSLLDSLMSDKLTEIAYGEDNLSESDSEDSDSEEHDRVTPGRLMRYIVRRDNLCP